MNCKIFPFQKNPCGLSQREFLSGSIFSGVLAVYGCLELVLSKFQLVPPTLETFKHFSTLWNCLENLSLETFGEILQLLHFMTRFGPQIFRYKKHFLLFVKKKRAYFCPKNSVHKISRRNLVFFSLFNDHHSHQHHYHILRYPWDAKGINKRFPLTTKLSQIIKSTRMFPSASFKIVCY